MADFKTLHDVPRGLRSLRGYPLTLDEINTLVEQAKPDGDGFAKRLGEAKAALAKQKGFVPTEGGDG